MTNNNNMIYFSLVLLASFTLCLAQNLGPVDETEFNCRTAQPPAVNCAVDPNCLYPNPRNCSQYYQCNEAFLAYRMECPLGFANGTLLVFNNNTKRCDYPSNYECSANPAPEPPEGAPTEAPIETTTEAPTEAPTGGPTDAPTEAPTDAPTDAPTEAQTGEPSETTTESPDDGPETTTDEPETTTGDDSESTTSESPADDTTTTLSPEPPADDPPALDDVCKTPQAQEELRQNCNTSRQCMFPDPTTCQGFVQCVPGFEVGFQMPCAQGNDGQLLYWNDNSYTCERRDNSTCTTPQLFGRQPPQSVLFALKLID